MAKMKRNIGDSVSGKIGNVVFVQMGGNSYVRSAPFRAKNNWSEQQILYRQRLSKISKLWNSFKSDQTKKIWKLAAESMNGYAWFIKKNSPALAIDGTLFDPTMLSVSDGHLIPLQKVTVEPEIFNDPVVNVHWQNDEHLKSDRLKDTIWAMTLTDGVFSPPVNTGFHREDLHATIMLPRPYAPNPSVSGMVNLYLFVSSSDELQYTQSVSFQLMKSRN